jgi:SAM-dependent methyltransferase
MESEEEAVRLDMKTDPEVVKKQALWAGLKPGMRVADLGCGSGKTSYHLNLLANPGGETIGVDISTQRIGFAKEHYVDDGLTFVLGDIRESLAELGQFDFLWIRFVLEYYRSSSFDILKAVIDLLKPGGILCLIDLDYNCLTHHGIPDRLNTTIRTLIEKAEELDDFDPYAGRKLYTYLYDLGLVNIDVCLSAHHLIFGELRHTDLFNFSKKVDAAKKKDNSLFGQYPGGYEEFVAEFNTSFPNPRRFTYTPVICTRGYKSA